MSVLTVFADRQSVAAISPAVRLLVRANDTQLEFA
jgi:hypothetical protein